MKRKTILMVIPNLGFGGAQRVFAELAEALRTDYTVIECAFNLIDGHAYRTGHEIVSLNVPGGRNIFQKIYYFIVRIIALKKLKRNLEIDYCISHLEGADYVNILSRCKEKIILCIHGSKIYDEAISGWTGNIRKQVLIRILYRFADKIVTVAHGIRNEMLEYFQIPSSRVAVINNGFDTQAIWLKSQQEIPEIYNDLFLKPVLVAHGRIAEEKGFDTLVAVMNDQRVKHRCRLLLIGDGLRREALVGQFRAAGISTFDSQEGKPISRDHDVFFIGFQSNPFPYLCRSSIFVLPSHFEGFPMSLGEAMTCNLPVIANDCPYGPGEILNSSQKKLGADVVFGKFGILIPYPSPIVKTTDDWCKAIHTLLTNDGLYHTYKKNVRGRADQFSLKNFARSWNTLLNETV
jgi:glycosyltransferase involved in cell wall biosynthesis